MGWARLDDRLPEHPKIDALSDGAFRLYINGILYSAGNLTDGFIPAARVPRLTPNYSKKHLAELLNHNLWHKREDGYDIHDYLHYQPSAAQVSEQREYEREKKARQRAAGSRSVGRSNTTGQFVSRRDTPRDSTRDGPRESFGESPATHPIPSSIDSSSSSSPLLGQPPDDDDDIKREAQRRLTDRQAALGPVADSSAWLAKCEQRIRAEGWQPPATPAPRPDCDACATTGVVLDDNGYATRCPTCNPAKETA